MPHNPKIIRLRECCQVPSGQMCIVGSGSIPIHIVCDYRGGEQLSCTPKIAYGNYLQDCFTFEHHGISYSEYMCRIADILIDTANINTQASVEHPDSCPILNGVWGHLKDGVLDAGLSVSHDFDIADKTRGFLNHSSANVSFTGPHALIGSL